MSVSQKLQFWLSEVRKKTFRCFLHLSELIEESGEHLPDMIVNDIKKHVSSFIESLTEFPNLQSKNNYWVQNPFEVTERPTELTVTDYENLIEITCDSVLKAKFEEVPVAVFWGNLNELYEKLSKQATRELLSFASTYLCESGFLQYSQMKTKYYARLDAASDMRIQLSNIKPNFSELLYSRKQTHFSH